MPRFTPVEIAAEDALATAIANRPELAQIDIDLQQQQLSVRKAENDTLPQIDLGLSGVVVGQDERYTEALGQLGTIDARSWNVFLNLTWTPLRRASRAAAEIERTRHAMAITRREQIVQELWLAVRNAVRNQRSAARQVAAAATFRELAEKSLEIEQRKFLNGTSSNLFVAQRQQELAQAQLAELTAVLGHTKAAVTLSRATGKLLDERNIELGVR